MVMHTIVSIVQARRHRQVAEVAKEDFVHV